MIEFFRDCFSLNLKDYENLRIDLEINKVLFIAFSALIIGIILFNMYRRNIKLAVTQLIRHGAKSEENAKTLSELGLSDARMINGMLLGDNLLTKIVARVGEKRFEYEEYKALTKEEKNEISTVDMSSARFYIRPEMSYTADEISSRYTSSVPNTVISCVFAGVLCICLMMRMPGILNLINNILG